MIIDISKVKIYVYPGETDMRKQINALSIRVQEDFGKELFSGALYLFCNKSRKRMKILYWDTNGFCLWIKRLEKDRFPWPRDKKEAQIGRASCRERV